MFDNVLGLQFCHYVHCTLLIEKKVVGDPLKPSKFLKKAVDFWVVVGYSIYTMTTNYSVGDNIRGSCMYRFGNELWSHIYEILDIETVSNFGKMEQLLTVNISITRGNITVIDKNVKRLSGQLF